MSTASSGEAALADAADRMLDRIAGFVDELRAIGVPVSMVEAIDAANALGHVDFADRSRVKHTFGATLVKNVRHWEAFETAFEVYFGGDSALDPAASDAVDTAAVTGTGAGAGGGDVDLDALADALFRALRDDDERLMGAVVRLAVRMLAGMQPGRPVGGTYYLYRVLRNMDLDTIRGRVLEELEDQSTRNPLAARLAGEEIDIRIEGFRSLLRAEIRKWLVADRGAGAVARTLRRPLVEDADLTVVTREQLAEIEAVIHPLTRKLAVRLAQRRKSGRQGRLDVRRTLRQALSTGGVPIDPRFRKPRPAKPDIVLLCDVSGSVSTFARFTMQMVHAISGQFSRVRSFAFIDAIDEVTGFFGPGVDFGHAMQRIGTEARVVWLDGHSDYGNAFGGFVERHMDSITPRTTVIVTGDARNNYHDPDVAALRAVARAARSVYWLNPERRHHWDTGDSVLSAYADVCDGVFEVRSLRQLERFVERVATPSIRPVQRIV